MNVQETNIVHLPFLNEILIVWGRNQVLNKDLDGRKHEISNQLAPIAIKKYILNVDIHIILK